MQVKQKREKDNTENVLLASSDIILFLSLGISEVFQMGRTVVTDESFNAKRLRLFGRLLWSKVYCKFRVTAFGCFASPQFEKRKLPNLAKHPHTRLLIRAFSETKSLCLERSSQFKWGSVEIRVR